MGSVDFSGFSTLVIGLSIMLGVIIAQTHWATWIDLSVAGGWALCINFLGYQLFLSQGNK